MGMYNFMMSCGHKAKREVAEPGKYYKIDKDYYNKQGLCDKCWDKRRLTASGKKSVTKTSKDAENNDLK